MNPKQSVLLRLARATRALHRVSFAAFAFIFVGVVNANPSGVEIIETANATLALKAGSGDLVSVEWKRPKLELIAEPRLGENFRILLPEPNYEPNYFNSRDQVVREVEKSPAGVILHYGPLKNQRGEVNVNVDYEIRDSGSQLEFSIKVDNQTGLPLAEVFYAVIGGQRGIKDRLNTESHAPGLFMQNAAPKLFSNYPIYSDENIGTGFDSMGLAYPGDLSMSWIDIYNPQAGVGYYYANQDLEIRQTLLHTELTPHAKPSLLSSDNWPTATALPATEPSGLTFGWINFPYTKRGTFRAGPVVLQVHEGDWRVAAKLFRGWFDKHYTMPPRSPEWLQQLMAWQRLTMSGNQDVIYHRFVDLPKLAAEAKQYGVTGIEILGWSVGGLERGDPAYSPDPRLGTIEEFRQALAEMRKIGVHPILYATLTQADTTTKDFRARWSKYVPQSRFGPEWGSLGFAHGTLGARGYSFGQQLRGNFTWVNPSHSEYHDYVIARYLDRVRDGADALHFETGLHGSPAFDFNPNLTTSPDKSMPQGTLKILADFLPRARGINPQFALSAMGPYHAAIPYIDVTYCVMGWGREEDATSTAFRYAFPEIAATIVLDRPEDFDRLNNGLRYGLVWVVGPRQFTASMDEELTRPLSRYLRELIRIRGKYPDLLLHGRFDDTEGATVIGDKDNVRYSTFQSMNPRQPERAVVIVNFGDRNEKALVRLPGADGEHVTISAPFERDRTTVLPVSLNLPPHQVAVVVSNYTASTRVSSLTN